MIGARGGRKRVREMAARVKSNDSREDIIRRMWQTREMHGVIAGAVGPYR
jgi:hypothetical protein